MESATSEKEAPAAAASSYTYWVREVTEEAAPLPVPRKLTSEDLSRHSHHPPTHLGSVWNRVTLESEEIPVFGEQEVPAGTWEEKNLNKWASDRIQELLVSVGSLEFSWGRAEITDVSKCVGDAFLVTVRNKKRVSYTYELTLRVKGEWLTGEEKKNVKGYIDIPEFSIGELDDLQFEVRLSKEKDLTYQDKLKIHQDLKLFLQPVREKLLQFEEELKER